MMLANVMLVGGQTHASAWPFLKPVDKAEVPGYYDYIKYPIGLFESSLINYNI